MCWNIHRAARNCSFVRRVNDFEVKNHFNFFLLKWLIFSILQFRFLVLLLKTNHNLLPHPRKTKIALKLPTRLLCPTRNIFSPLRGNYYFCFPIVRYSKYPSKFSGSIMEDFRSRNWFMFLSTVFPLLGRKRSEKHLRNAFNFSYSFMSPKHV